MTWLAITVLFIIQIIIVIALGAVITQQEDMRKERDRELFATRDVIDRLRQLALQNCRDIEAVNQDLERIRK